MTRQTASRSLWILGIAAALVFAAALAGAPPASAEPIYAKWFRYGQGVERAWEFSEVKGDPMRVSIRRKKANLPMGPQRHVFVLYPRPSSAYDVAITKILQVFEEKNINAEIMVVNFRKDPARGKAAVKFAKKNGYELIFSMGSESTAWLWKNYRGGDIPVVSVCSKDPVVLGQIDGYDKGTNTNFAFTSLNMPVEVQMAYVFELKPNLKNLGVLVNSKNVSAVETQAKPIAKFARERGIQVLNLAVKNPKHAAKELAQMVRDAVNTMRKSDPTLDNSVFWITGSTAVFRAIRAINANSDRVPVLSVVPNVVKAGDDSAVLSIGISFESNAHLAAIYGADVLLGRVTAGSLKVGIVSPPDIAINFRKAREIALDIPFRFFESAGFIYDYDGRPVRENGKPVAQAN